MGVSPPREAAPGQSCKSKRRPPTTLETVDQALKSGRLHALSPHHLSRDQLAKNLKARHENRNQRGSWGKRNQKVAPSSLLPSVPLSNQTVDECARTNRNLDECAQTPRTRFDSEVTWLMYDEGEGCKTSKKPRSIIKQLRPDGQQPEMRPRCMQLSGKQDWYPKEGDSVVAKVDFHADGKSKTYLSRGLPGAVVSIAADGAAVIDFHGLEKCQWVYRHNFDKLQKVN